jgi:hypothetical protein
MVNFASSWSLCGGWAVDAWLGRQTRDHSDIDITVFQDEVSALPAHFEGWALTAHDAIAPDDSEPWDGHWLTLPAHVHVRQEDGFHIDVQVGERSAHYRVLNREPRIAIDLARCAASSRWGVPTLVPEVVLFYKAMETRPQDDADFVALLPYLALKQIVWLRKAIRRVRPDHAWLSQLAVSRRKRGETA